MGIARIGVIELMFLFGPLVIVPLGMELGKSTGGSQTRTGRWLEEVVQVLQPLGAVLVVVAVLLPPGNLAGWIALGWMLVCGIAALGGVLELFKSFTARSLRATQFAASVGRIDLAVGGAWLVASRWGMRPIGIQEPIGLLTAVHFHFAGFATAMIAGSTLRFAESRVAQRWLPRVVVLVVLMPSVVAAGFVISPVMKMIAAVAFSLSVAVLAGYVWKWGGNVGSRQAMIFLRVAASSVFVGMGLSSAYAVVNYLKSDALTIPRMAGTHGVVNALGFCLLGLLGWLVESSAH